MDEVFITKLTKAVDTFLGSNSSALFELVKKYPDSMYVPTSRGSLMLSIAANHENIQRLKFGLLSTFFQAGGKIRKEGPVIGKDVSWLDVGLQISDTNAFDELMSFIESTGVEKKESRKGAFIEMAYTLDVANNCLFQESSLVKRCLENDYPHDGFNPLLQSGVFHYMPTEGEGLKDVMELCFKSGFLSEKWDDAEASVTMKETFIVNCIMYCKLEMISAAMAAGMEIAACDLSDHVTLAKNRLPIEKVAYYEGLIFDLSLHASANETAKDEVIPVFSRTAPRI